MFAIKEVTISRGSGKDERTSSYFKIEQDGKEWPDKFNSVGAAEQAIGRAKKEVKVISERIVKEL